jgi:hypothetical protein
VEPDPLGQPEDHQGDVRPAEGLPVSVHGSGRRPLIRRALLVALALGALVAAPARAGTYIDRAVAHFASDPVYVDPGAKPTLPPSEAGRLRREIARANAGSVYVAILPAAARNEAGGDAGALLRRLYEGVGNRGTYAVVAGGQFRAGSNYPGFRKGQVPGLATTAFRAHRADGLGPTLVDFVHRLGAARAGGGSSGGKGNSWWPFLLVALAVGGVLYANVRRRRARREREELAQVSKTARDDLIALANDIDGVRADINEPEAQKELEQALQQYDRASQGLDRAGRPADLEQVSAALAEGRYLISRAQARQAGTPVPERTPPCFFDPRHGPSTREVEWAPPGGTPRPVPACEADARRIEHGEDPETRELDLAGRRVPYYAAPAYYGPYYGGFGFGGFFPGLFLGEVLGGGFGGGYVDPSGSDFGDAGGASSDLGDFGGGDFGGGDFGGGGGDGGDF